MNLTIATTASKAWRRLRWQYVSLVGGLALAAILAVNLNDSSAGQASASRAAPSFSASRAALSVPLTRVEEPVLVVYFAGTQEQADTAQYYEATIEAERIFAVGQTPKRDVSVFLVRTVEEDTAAHWRVNDAMAAANFSDSNPAPRFELIDLR